MQELDDIIEIIKDELNNLGISFNNLENESKKSSFYQSSSKFLGLHSNSKGKYADIFSASPKKEVNYGMESQKTPKKCAPKSPFATKNKIERKSARKKKLEFGSAENVTDCVFGCELDIMEMCSATLADGSVVYVPKFVLDASKIIINNVSLEGLFRKGGSAQRQNDIKALLKSGSSLPIAVHPIDAACLLKQFLGQLPSRLVPIPVNFLMMRCLSIAKHSQLEALNLCTLLLPKRNKDLLAFILELLSFVAASSESNKMNYFNLAVVLAPNIIPTGGKASFLENNSAIEIVKIMIEGANSICKFSEKLTMALEAREKSRSVENLLQDQSSAFISRKKRRSASLHKIVNGFLRVVHGSSSAPEIPVVASPQKVSTPPIVDPGLSDEICLSPDIESRSIENHFKRKSDGMDYNERKICSFQPSESSRPKKKAKIDVKSVRTDAMAIVELMPMNELLSKNTLVSEKSPEINRRYSFRERKNEMSSIRSSGRRKSLVSISDKRSFQNTQSSNSLKLTPKSNSPHSSYVHATTKRAKSFNLHRTYSAHQKEQNSNKGMLHDDGPVGSDVVNLGPRGVPDGAEDNIRKSPLFQVKLTSSIRDQDGEFIECSTNKDSSLGYQQFNYDPSSGTQLVSYALEKVENETKALNSIQDENFTRRLTKELRNRSRRSGEFRVIRSPSERRIGSIRRRSKELEQCLTRNPDKKCDDQKNQAFKFKGNLMPSPQTSLKRGKPNSIKSGLPVIVKPCCSETIDHLNKITPPTKAICVQKRRSKNVSPISLNSSLSMKDSSDTLDISGPITRIRSSLTSGVVIADVTPDLPVVDNSFDKNFQNLSIVQNLENYPLPKELSDTVSPQKDCQENEFEWISAHKYLKGMHHQESDLRLTSEISGNRPSIKALKEQKKVTANVQFFNKKMFDQHSDSIPRRSTRYKSLRDSRNSRTPLRNTKSDNTNLKIAVGTSPASNYLMPHKVSKNKVQISPQVPVISPLKERNSAELTISTPKIVSKVRKTPKMKRLDSVNIPSVLTPLPPRPYKPPHLSTPITSRRSFETPPRIPVRLRKTSPSL